MTVHKQTYSADIVVISNITNKPYKIIHTTREHDHLEDVYKELIQQLAKYKRPLVNEDNNAINRKINEKARKILLRYDFDYSFYSVQRLLKKMEREIFDNRYNFYVDEYLYNIEEGLISKYKRGLTCTIL